jgi:hypothetical protein
MVNTACLEILQRGADARFGGFLLRFEQFLVAFLRHHDILRPVVADDVHVALGDEVIHRADAAPLDLLGRNNVHRSTPCGT